MFNKFILSVCLIFCMSLVAADNSRSGTSIKGGFGKVQRIDAVSHQLVVGDLLYKIDKNVSVHSEFVSHDYLSRVRTGQFIEFTFRKVDGIRYVNEIWIKTGNFKNNQGLEPRSSAPRGNI